MRWHTPSFVGVAAAALAVLVTAAPAHAHDQLIDSTPAAGDALAAAPTEVELAYSGDLLTLGDGTSGADILVVDESGHDWADGAVQIDGNTATVPLEEGMPEAGYQIRWQVVSEDGHPITGVVPFTVGDAAPYEAPAADDEESADAATAPDAAEAEESSAPRVVVVALAGALVAAGAFAVITFLRRRAARAASDDARENTN
ncbi:copper resistance CopC family protein [Microbacterium excoecariae]|uniref:copper resistance CopC family protein n=1 Tax=Microbacterium excoecariae TaxID=2715210 RepID=UPI00140C9C61|nr:copper resistance protein CopC [Microbacterium excoecariae]NHI15601.1 copper resistance protein CopC [Microbacterium excoecariae]